MDKELTVREAMIMVLDKSPDEFEKMKLLFKKASDAFDVADDQNGLTILSEEVFPMVRSLAEFFSTIFDYHLGVLGDEVGIEFCEKIKLLNELLATLAEETHNANFTEVGDILRFDLYDFICDLEGFWPKIKACFEESKLEGLDQY